MKKNRTTNELRSHAHPLGVFLSLMLVLSLFSGAPAHADSTAPGTGGRSSQAGATKNIRLDTTGLYKCNTSDTYDFVAYTSSPTPPAASTANSLVSVQYVGKVSGGYQYRMTAHGNDYYSLFSGSSQVNITQGGETVSFSVDIDNTFVPTVKSDTGSVVKLYKGQSYTYKFTIMGGSEPSFTGIYDGVGTRPTGGGIMDAHLVKKDGLNYYVKYTATSDNIGDESGVCVELRKSYHVRRELSPNEWGYVDYSTIVIGPNPSKPVIPMKSDTTKDFTLAENRSYTFKLTGAAQFTTNFPWDVRIELLRKSGSDSYYRITPTLSAGVHLVFFMYNGYKTQKVCNVTVGNPIILPVKSDTTQNFSLARGKSYTFKLTGATAFNPGTEGVFTTKLVKRSGTESLYRITAVGPSGSSSGMYMGDGVQHAKRICTVSVS